MGQYTWPVIKENVEPDVILVTEEEIVTAMRLIWERMKIVVEPSGAVVLAAALTTQFMKIADDAGLKNIGLILCGGNTNLDCLPWQQEKK